MNRFVFFCSFVLTTFLGFDCAIQAQQHPLDLRFQHLTPFEGLSQGTNAYIFKDSRGFIWISSTDGLNRFDGTAVKIYKPIPSDSLSLFGRNITSQFFEDALGNIWFTTHEGINCYQRASDNFKSYQLKNEANLTLSKDYYAFFLDKHNRLWLRTGIGSTGRLHLFDTKNAVDSISFPLDGQRCQVVLNEQNEVTQVVSSMLSKPGFEIREVQKKGEKQYYSLVAASEKIDNNPVFTQNTYAEGDSLLWIGSMAGLIEFDLKHRKINSINSLLESTNEQFGHFCS